MASLVATGSLQEFPESGLISSKWAAAAAGTRTPRAARPARRGERVTAGGGGWCQLELERLELTDAYVSPPVVLSELTWCWASSLNGGISFRSKDVQIDGRCVVCLGLIASQRMTPLLLHVHYRFNRKRRHWFPFRCGIFPQVALTIRLNLVWLWLNF